MKKGAWAALPGTKSASECFGSDFANGEADTIRVRTVNRSRV